MIKFGITERGDAGLNLSWFDNLKPANILITKNLNDDFIANLMFAYNEGHKIIVHVTCTGFGGKPVEKNVPIKEWTHQQVFKLIRAGFPVNQLVLRIDPIVPTDKGIETALSVLDLFNDTGIKRVRYSFMDMYDHVKVRFKQQGIPIPYDTFNAPVEMQRKAIKYLKTYESRYELESCAEQTEHKIGCISKKDFLILDIPLSEIVLELKGQRKTCACVGNKYELLTLRKPCSHQCSYCFWK